MTALIGSFLTWMATSTPTRLVKTMSTPVLVADCGRTRSTQGRKYLGEGGAVTVAVTGFACR